LANYGFNIEDVSMASGSGVHSTFLTCHRVGKRDDLSYTNSRRDEVDLRRWTEAALKHRYDEYFEEERKEVHKAKPNVVVRLVSDEPWKLQFCLGLRFKDAPGFLSGITSKLRSCFMLDDASIRPPIRQLSDHMDALDRKQRILVMRFSPRKDILNGEVQYKPVEMQCDYLIYVKDIVDSISRYTEEIDEIGKQKTKQKINKDLQKIYETMILDLNIAPIGAYAVYAKSNILNEILFLP
jgi:hypothetical protein